MTGYTSVFMKLPKNALLLLPGTIWGVSFIVVELILPYVPPFTLTLLRTLISVLMLLVLIRVAKASLPKTWQEWRPFFALALVNQAAPFALSSWGQLYIEGGLASILLSIMPMFTVLIAFWFTSDEPITLNKSLGIGLGLIGVIILIGPSALSGLGVNLVAQLAVVGSALLYAIGAVYTRYVYPLQPKGMSTWNLRLRITASQFICSAVLLLPFSLIVDKPWLLRPPLLTWFHLLFLGIGVTLLATMVYFYLIEEFGAGTASMTIYLIPVAGVITGMIVLDEQLTLNMIIALGFILSGIFIVNNPFKSKIKTL